ncbi:sterol carrier protein [Halococcus morrhuae DSM 1307]|uniref:Sterol carrier protein n=1 Tax=Halococcus morrhuae DSM 1307 TaxID=931277 RepID=M0MB74_HALMO|nr:SCP2 sterol-binding domain-containing protein [Halococcus morrhuae]EMA42991.1 sterol carrier protein [Halococcus morrhuae DSM 1307]
MALYPTEQWLAAYKDRLDNSEALDEAGAGWGVDFDGDIYFVITDVPVSETTLGDLPDEAMAGLPDRLRDQLADIPLDAANELIGEEVRAELPEKSRDLLRQLDEYIVDGTVYAFIGLKDGGCEEVAVVEDPAERDVGFRLRGTHETWSALVDGDREPIPAAMSGDLEVEGDMGTILQYSDATALLGEIAAEVETTHLFERADQ